MLHQAFRGRARADFNKTLTSGLLETLRAAIEGIVQTEFRRPPAKLPPNRPPKTTVRIGTMREHPVTFALHIGDPVSDTHGSHPVFEASICGLCEHHLGDAQPVIPVHYHHLATGNDSAVQQQFRRLFDLAIELHNCART